jgi:hypothetical protein
MKAQHPAVGRQKGQRPHQAFGDGVSENRFRNRDVEFEVSRSAVRAFASMPGDVGGDDRQRDGKQVPSARRRIKLPPENFGQGGFSGASATRSARLTK